MDTNAVIGLRIKNLRNEKKYTLKYVSENTGLSIGFLSQLERGMTSIAIDSLDKIAKLLGVELSSFFHIESPTNGDYIMRRYEHKANVVNPEIIEYSLTHNIEEFSLLPRLVEVMPAHQDESELELYTHDGEEFIYILEGILTLQIEEEIFLLYPGDSAHVHSNAKHNWKNETNNVVRFLTVHTPNPFQRKSS